MNTTKMLEDLLAEFRISTIAVMFHVQDLKINLSIDGIHSMG